VAGMDLTLALKFLHVIGAAILFGTGLGSAVPPLAGRPQGGAHCNRGDAQDRGRRRLPLHRHRRCSPAGHGAHAHAPWRLWSRSDLDPREPRPLCVVGLCWLPVVAIQIKMRDLAERAVAAKEGTLPARYHLLARLWFWLGWPAFSVDARHFLADARQACLMLHARTRTRPTR
jgi:hypothetical protein